jgi:hypothetical protein
VLSVDEELRGEQRNNETPGYGLGQGWVKDSRSPETATAKTWDHSTITMIVHEMENELIKIWNLTVALSEQLQENRAITAQLRAQADVLKVLYVALHRLQPSHSFVL